MDFSSLLEPLNIQLLPITLATREWKEGYFNDESEITPDYEFHLQSVSAATILSEMSSFIFSGLKSGSLRSWSDLIQLGIDFKRFLYLIHHFLTTAISNEEDERHRTNGIWSARLYFSFLATPERSQFLIFQSNLYARALKTLKFSHLLERPHFSGRGSGSRKSTEDMSALHSVELTAYESRNLLQLVVGAERDLLCTLQISDFALEGNAVAITIEVLSDLAIQETHQADLLSNEISEARSYHRSSLSMNAFYGLLMLLNEKYGEVEETVRLIMRYAFNAIIMGFRKNLKNEIPGNVKIVREVFVDFICKVCTSAKQSAEFGLSILLQHLCLYAPDRADARSKLIECVTRLFFKLPQSFLLKLNIAMVKMSCHPKTSVRLFSVQVLGNLLTQMKVNFSDGKPGGGYNLLKILFTAVLARIQDTSAIVRSNAMLRIASYLQDSPENSVRKYLLSEVFVEPYLQYGNIQEVQQRGFVNFHKFAKDLQENPTLEVPLPCACSILKELVYFSSDRKVIVRKSALQCLLKILCLNVKFMDMDILKEIGTHCQDEGVLVRKMMVHEFTDLLLTFPCHQHLLKQWTISIIPLLHDKEITVAEKAMENLRRAILENMVMYTQMVRPVQHLPWMLINCISQHQLKNFFLKACSVWKEEILRPYLHIVKSHIGMDKPYNNPAWEILMCFAHHMTIKNPQFVMDFYRNEIHEVPNVSTYTSLLVMEVLWLTWKQLPSGEQERLANELNTDLLLFKVPVSLISRAVDIRHGLYLLTQKGEVDIQHPEWAANLIKKCEESIFEILRLNSDRIQDEEAMKRFILTLGNVCLYCPKTVQKRTTQQLLQMLHPTEEAVCDLWSGSCDIELKAGLIVALGKIGLQNETLAISLINILGLLLNVRNESIVKNNVMICLTDLSIRYTSLNDDLLSDMCVCLKDSQQSVRENTLKLLVKLIQEDYIKIGDKIIFHLLTMLNDTDSSIVELTRSLFLYCILQKKSKCFTSSFIPSIFHFNNYEFRHSKIHQTNQEKEVFDLSGSANREKRYNIYHFMLSRSDDENRFTISRRLCIEICNGVLDGKITLNRVGEDVLRDCLHVMDCDEIRITHNKELDEDDEAPADDEDASELLLNTAHDKFLSGLVKKHLLDTEIPILVKLRRKLVAQQSLLTADVLRVIQSMIQDHKLDVDEVLRSDPHLIRELKRKSKKTHFNTFRGSNSESSSEQDDE